MNRLCLPLIGRALLAAALLSPSAALAQRMLNQQIAPPVSQPAAVAVMLSAGLEGDPAPLRKGLVWRVYADDAAAEKAVLVRKTDDAAPVITLDPGAYIVHVTWGLASATRRVVVGQTPINEKIMLSAGGLRLGASLGDMRIPKDRLTFSIYVAVGNDPQGRVIVENVRGEDMIRLPEGQYRIVSNYGDTNATTSADIRVESGKVVDALMRHRAATVTLKLVANPGAEALANTTFSLVTPGGDIIREAIGAFPSMTLAEGDYVVIARNGGRVFTQEFKVKSGVDRDVEVLAR
jgi:hypothetical protein